jgi:hypothetical protein
MSENDDAQRRLTGISAITAGVLALVVVPLYFIYAGPPPAWNVLSRTLISVGMLGAMMLYLIGLRHYLRRAGVAASIAYGAGMTYIAVSLVSESMEAGVPLYTPGGALDPTIDGPLAAGMVLIHGPIARVLSIVFLVALGYAISRTKALPGWVSASAYVLAVANLAFIPSLYFGMNPANFYAANGWGSTATISGLMFYWTAAVGVAILRRRDTEPVAGARTHTPATLAG